MPGSPPLLLHRTGPQLDLSWPARWAGFVLEYKTNLASPFWTVPPYSPQLLNGTNTLRTNTTGNAGFFRLSKVGP